MPTIKSKSIEDFLTSIAGISRQEGASKGICVTCKNPVQGFKDRLSEKEYHISGMCQKCQDSVFGELEDE